MTDVAATDAIKIPNVIRARKKEKIHREKQTSEREGSFSGFKTAVESTRVLKN